MSINTSLANLIVVKLPRDLEGHDNELRAAVDMARRVRDCDVIVDFSHTRLVASPTLSRLLELRKLMHGSRQRLVLCGMNPAARSVFAVAQLDTAFDFARDLPAALAGLHGYA